MTLNQHKNQKLRHNRYCEECSTMGNLINRIPGSRLLISSLPGSQASRCQPAFLKSCLVNLISKDTHLVFSIYVPSASRKPEDITYPADGLAVFAFFGESDPGCSHFIRLLCGFSITLVNVYVGLVLFTRIAGTS